LAACGEQFQVGELTAAGPGREARDAIAVDVGEP
jgi:hypothetical protein